MTLPVAMKHWKVASGLLMGLVLSGALSCKQNQTNTARNPAPPAQGATNATGTTASGAKTCLAIVDGQTTTAYPATYLTVSLVNRAAHQATFCTGTFVSDNTMITAAHCVPECRSKQFLSPHQRRHVYAERRDV